VAFGAGDQKVYNTRIGFTLIDYFESHQNDCPLIHDQYIFPAYATPYYLARGKLAVIDNVVCLLHVRGILIGPIQGRARQSHETRAGRLQNAKGSNKLEERIYPRWLRRSGVNSVRMTQKKAWRRL
jgi:hypothetical protein